MTNTQNEPLPDVEWLDKAAKAATFTNWRYAREAASLLLRLSIIDHAKTLYELDAAQKEIERLREALEANHAQGDPLKRAELLAKSLLPEDAPVRALCEKHGYGAVMDSASRQWLLKDSRGALLVGTCYSIWRNTLGKGDTHDR